MRISYFCVFILVLVSSHGSVTCSAYVRVENFIQCLIDRTDPSLPISDQIYTPENPSFSSVLQNYLRNLRFNESTTPKPVVIITALYISHIQSAILCAQTHYIEMKIRSGGHDYEGLSYVVSSGNPFFILDMFNFRSVKVNIPEETAWVETGATLGEVYYRIAEKSNVHGFPAGVCPTVGVGGHFSGGGYGNMMRKYGLAADNIIDAQLIDVNGKLLDRKSMGEDLFWAITGGGAASFGVVLAYKIKLVRVPPIVTFFDVRRTSDETVANIAYHWLQVAHKLDHGLFIRMVLTVEKEKRGGKTMRARFPSLFLGNATRLVALMDENFPELGVKMSDCIEMPWIESVLFYRNIPVGTPLDVLLDRTFPRLDYLKIKSDYVKKPITKEGFELIFKKMKELENQMLTFNPYGGRMSEISEFEKPFPHRAGNIAKIQYDTNWNECGEKAAQRYVNFTRMLYDYMTPFVSKLPREAFLNYRDLDIGINHHGENSYLEGAVYGLKYFKESNYNRLVKVKTSVDPNNFFRNEQSIPIMPY